jgi:hypothetical protein
VGKPRQPHFTCYESALLTLLAQDRRTLPAHLIQLSGRNLRVVLDEPAALSAPVSIETGDWLAIGEVCSCRAEYTHYAIGLQLEQMLIGLRDLLHVQREWLSQTVPPPSFLPRVSQQPFA